MEIESSERRTDWPTALEPVFAFFSRVFVWGMFFGTLLLLRSFFLLIFLTFVFSYIQSHGVEKIRRYIPNRSLAVCTVGVSLLCILVAVGWFMVPQVVKQAKLVADKHASYFQTLDTEVVRLSKRFPVINTFISVDDLNGVELDSHTSGQTYDTSHSLSLKVLQQLAGFSSNENKAEANISHLVELTRNIGQPLLAIGSAFFLSLLFSFLIILDLPRLTESIMSLADSKIAFVFEEVAPSIKSFATVLGRAFQAQLLIAIINTALTAGGIYLLGLQKSVAFLSLIVFICGFIPVAGVFISSVPICLMALPQGGMQSVIFAVLFIWLIHMVEAYVLNPRIFGEKLKINPVIVLIILTLAGKLFGVWGLILSLPIYTYIFGYAIKYDELKSSSEGDSEPDSIV